MERIFRFIKLKIIIIIVIFFSYFSAICEEYDILNKNWFLTKTDCSWWIKCTDFYNQTWINQVQQVFNRQLQQLKWE